VEQGTARWVDRRGRSAAPIMLRENDFLTVRRDEAPSVQQHLAADFVASLPSNFRDAIPLRLAKFKGHELVAKSRGAFSYAEVESWINAEGQIRRQFVRTWRIKADDMAFRASLEQSLSQHPEWGPVLYPELYEPKPPPQATPSGQGSVAGPVAVPLPQSPNNVAPH